MTTRLDHTLIKARGGSEGDVLVLDANATPTYTSANTVVIAALTAGDNMVIEANGLVVSTASGGGGDASPLSVSRRSILTSMTFG